MEQSPRLSLPYILPQQSQKHVTVNEGLRRLDALVQMSVHSRTLSDQPQSPMEGDAYILPATPLGADWSSFAAGTVAVFQDTTWIAYVPQLGWRAHVRDEAGLVVFGETGWASLAGGGSPDQVPRFGINTMGDDTNRLAVKSDAALFSHDDVTPGTGDMRLLINKQATSNTAAFLFQTAFAGKVEFGLLGTDHFSAKVSIDGVNFVEALHINSQTATTTLKQLRIGDGGSLARIDFDTDQQVPFWAIGQADDQSFFIQRLSGGFGTGGKVLIYDNNGALGLWGPPLSKGKIATRSNVNADAVDNILYLEQTALSPAGGVAQFHNNVDNVTPILRCTTNSRTVLNVPADGSIELGASIRMHSVSVAQLPSAVGSGAGAVVYVTDAAGGGVLVFSDGAQWRRVTDRAVVTS